MQELVATCAERQLGTSCKERSALPSMSLQVVCDLQCSWREFHKVTAGLCGLLALLASRCICSTRLVGLCLSGLPMNQRAHNLTSCCSLSCCRRPS